MNATLQKFGFPESCVWKGRHWAVLLRPQQATLGALVLCTLSDATCHAELNAEARAEHGTTLGLVERALQKFRPYSKINFLTLMMVDPHVHTHVLPRYDVAQDFEAVTFVDPGWPALPDLKTVNALPDDVGTKLLHQLKAAFAHA